MCVVCLRWGGWWVGGDLGEAWWFGDAECVEELLLGGCEFGALAELAVG